MIGYKKPISLYNAHEAILTSNAFPNINFIAKFKVVYLLKPMQYRTQGQFVLWLADNDI